MSAFDSFNSLFWRASKTTKMLDAMTLLDEAPRRDINVVFLTPDVQRMNGQTQSRDYEIEYQTADAPNLREGARVKIDGRTYRLRSDPFIPYGVFEPMDGYWHNALLTPE